MKLDPATRDPARLDPAVCEKARLARDRRFDGRFFIGVVTTGIFCRPICPVRPPKAQNVRFYPSAAAASEAGFRPCLRCRPEAAPGTPAWLGTEATVARALRLIEEGALDQSSVEQLGERLGLGGRHLRRLFRQHLGASPRAVAQTRRLLFAKSLLDETALPLTEVAMAAGFGSLRRFNEAFRKSYGQPPGKLRRKRRQDAKTPGPRTGLKPCQLRLPFRPPYAWPALLGYLAARATPGVEAVQDGRYRRSVTVNGSRGWIEIGEALDDDSLILRIAVPRATSLLALVNRLRRVFDTSADPPEITSHLAKDPALAPLVAAQPGLRLPGAWDGFELAVRAILGQQVTVKGATTLAGRLAAAFGEALPGLEPEGLSHLFPTPAALAEADPGVIGLPKTRAGAIKALATATRGGALAFDGSMDTPALQTALVALPGIGPWTADYIALRALGDPDAFPAGDLGLIRAARRLGIAEDEKSLLARAEAWRPWRAYAAQHLWLSESSSPGKNKPEQARETRRKAKGRVLHAYG